MSTNATTNRLPGRSARHRRGSDSDLIGRQLATAVRRLGTARKLFRWGRLPPFRLVPPLPYLVAAIASRMPPPPPPPAGKPPRTPPPAKAAKKTSARAKRPPAGTARSRAAAAT